VKNKTDKYVQFSPTSTGRYKYSYSGKARPLAFELKFLYKTNDASPYQILNTYKLEQDYKNAIREEYKVYGVPEDFIPKYTTGSDNDFDEKLLPQNLVYCDYDPKDIPKGDKLNGLFNVLPANEYTCTSSYRNPYRNQYAGSTAPTSRHVWSGAFDLVDKNGYGYTLELKSLWETIKGKTEFGQVLVEGDLAHIQNFIAYYIKDILGENLVEGSVVIKAMQNPLGSYVIVWSKQTGWQWVQYDWKELMPDGITKVEHKDDKYTLQEADWDRISKNLHAQDKISSEWGF
jgi:hypothetical protein